MPNQKITDLSDLLSEPKHVRLRKSGPVYTLPGDIPAELYLQLMVEAERYDELQKRVAGGDQVDEDLGVAINDMARSLRGRVLELFRYGDPDLQALPPEMNLAQLVSLIQRLYTPESEQADRPTTAKRSAAGTSSSKPPRQRKSRS